MPLNVTLFYGSVGAAWITGTALTVDGSWALQ